MKTKRIQGKSYSFAWRLITFGILVAVTGFASVAGATYSLPVDRSVVWKGNVGVVGDIPSRTTVYTTLNPSGGDDAPAIKAAISNCPTGQVVKLNAGTFKVSSSITMKSGITLRGAGMGTTIIQGASGMSGYYLIGFLTKPAEGTSFAIAAGMSKGSTTITTASPHGWSVGDIVLIDQLNNTTGDPVVTSVGTNGTCTWCGRGSGARSLGQVSKVIAVPSSTTAILEIPLYWNYDASLSPQATKISGITSNAGIEDLTIDNELSGDTSSPAQGGDGATIGFYGTSNCWLLRVEAIGSYRQMVRMKRSYRDTIRSCKFHEGVPALPATGPQYATSRSYGIFMNPASGVLVENTQIYHLDMATLLDGPASGNVFAYNYVGEMYYSPSLTWQSDSFRFHGAHPIMNLFEGNYVVGRVNADIVWGSSSHNTFFRNRNTMDPTRPAAGWDYSMYKNASYYNIIGNVIGTTGFETAYSTTPVSSNKTRASYAIDPSVVTTLQHANWDIVTNGVVWNGSDDRVLPASLYLSSKPSWWGNIQWPAIGPDVSPMYPVVPPVGQGTPWSSTKAPLSPPALLKAQ
jgi:hypothetical protein